jgi:resuscitation-promoting factor RpfA
VAKNDLGRVLFGVGAAVGVASALYLAVGVIVRVWVRVRRRDAPRRRAGAPLLSLVGSGLALATPAAAQFGPVTPPRSRSTSIVEARHTDGARERSSPLPSHAGSHNPPAPPWSEPGGFPPPRPAGRTGEASRSAPRRGGRSEPAKAVRQVVVKPGDSLWSIAAEILETSDPARIARYWPLIHRSNRELIGANPNLIFPGQVLELPDETSRK